MKQYPSKNSTCLNEVVFTTQVEDFIFTLKFYSLFDVQSTYHAFLQFQNKIIENIFNTSGFTAITEMLSKIDHLKNGKYQNNIKNLEELSLIIYNKMITLNKSDLERDFNA